MHAVTSPDAPRVSGPIAVPRARLCLTAALAAALLLAGCGGPPAAKTIPGRTPAGSPSPQHHGQQMHAWPLTGLPAHGAPPKRPVIVVKMDNTLSSRPQIGLGSADLVTEELVEGGLTRLAAFYYSRLPKLVGPVRSMRASDIGVVKPVHATIVTSGAAPLTYGRLKANHVHWIENFDNRPVLSGREGFVRSATRQVPYNLFMRTARLLHLLKAPKRVPQSYLDFGAGDRWQRHRMRHAATSIVATFSPSHATMWSYQSGRYVNTNTNSATATQFRPKTLLVLRVHEKDAGYLDPAGHHVPETVLTGKGSAFLFAHGKMLSCTWSKKSVGSTISLAQGKQTVQVPPGKVWIELLPTDSDGGGLSIG